MPRRDGTGPVGRGPFTGRGLGNCDMPRRARRGQRKGFPRNQETLEERKERLENEVKQIDKEIENLLND